MARRGGISRTERTLNMLQRRGVQRGVFGTSRAWFWVAIGAWVLRRVRRVVGSEPELVYRGEIKPGQALRIDHLTEVYGTPRRSGFGRRRR
jgi:hypothetical protein